MINCTDVELTNIGKYMKLVVDVRIKAVIDNEIIYDEIGKGKLCCISKNKCCRVGGYPY
jgi:hypothetical protein